jgi:hypothetical protein
MRCHSLLIALLLGLGVAAPSASQVLPCEPSGGLRLSTEQLRKRAVREVDLSGPVRQLDVKGVAVLDVWVDVSGDVQCAKVIHTIHPMVGTEIEKAVRQWKFRPLEVAGERKPFGGLLQFRICNISCGEEGFSTTIVFALPEHVVDVSVCAVLKRPSAFNGKMIRLTGVASEGFEYYGLSEKDCGAIWLDTPDEPFAPQTDFPFIWDNRAEELDNLMSKKQLALVTLVGRLDGVDEIEKRTSVRRQQTEKDGSQSAIVSFGSNGFGHMGEYKARLIIHRVEQVASNPKVPDPN